MAITQTTYTGNGSTTNYSFTFEYLKQADVKVTLDTVATTAFTFANATTLAFTTAPASGVAIRIFRNTAIDTLSSTFFSGSAIKAEDLNQNFTQNLYVTQEADFEVDTANTTANTAKTTADAATATANSATTTANSATTTANSAVTTANSAVTTANGAVTTANSAVTTANSAVTTANSAVTTANSAATAVANVVLYDPITNVAAIPGSPSNDTYIEIADSTGIQSFNPLSGLPSGFVGDSGLTVRLRYQTNTWVFQNYFANNAEDRYFTKTSGNTNATNIAANVTSIATKMPLAGGTFTGAVSFDDNVIVKGDSTNGSGKLTLNCENNSHGVHIKGPPHSAAATYTLTLPNNTGTNGQALLTNGSGVMSWGTVTTDLSSVLPLSGGTLTGSLTLSGAPTSNLHAATKAYVDSNATGTIVADGGNFDSGASLVSTSTTYDGGSF